MFDSQVMLPPPLVGNQAAADLTATIACPYPVYSYADKQLATEYVGQLLWAAHTITNGRRKKNTSTPTWLNLYACWANGVWRYHPEEHCLTRHLSRDVHQAVAAAAQNRWFITKAPCVFVVSTIPSRDAGDRFGKQLHVYHSPIEAGRAVERMFLQCAALGLVSVPVSEFDSSTVKRTLVLSRQEEPLCLMPVGWPDRMY